MNKMLFAVAAAALLLGFGGSASAAITIDIDDSLCSGCTNVHVLSDTGLDSTVFGAVSADTVDVIFTGIETIDSSGDGFGTVWVGATDGSTTSLDIAVESGFTFNRLGFNINEPSPPLPSNPSWDIRITAFHSGGSYTEEFFGVSANTAFRVDSTDGGMTHVLVQLLDPDGNPAPENGYGYTYQQGQRTLDATAYWQGLGQIKMDGVVPDGGITAVPEPSTWALMLLGFGGAGALIRRRRYAVA